MKVLVAGHDLKFIQFYIKHLEKSRHEVKIDKWENHIGHNLEQSFELLNWAEVIFCEWGLGNTIFYSQNKRVNQKLIVRLHRQELETSYLSESKIENIDSFITVSPFIFEEFSRKFGLPREKMHMIYNSVDTEKFSNHNEKEKKYNIGMVGYLPKLKRLDLALDIFDKLYNVDNRYHLHIKGKHPQELQWLWRIEEERAFYEEQFERIERAKWKDNIVFEPFGDVVQFYNKMEYILSVSDVESFHLAAAEGMACGAIPIIMNWEGSETIYSKKFIISNINQVPDYIENKRLNRNKIEKVMQADLVKFNEHTILKEMDLLILRD